MRKKLRKRRYFIALLLTTCFFIIGILIGSVVTQNRIDYIQNLANEQKIDFDSLQTQYLFLSYLNKQGNCDAIEKTLNINIKNLVRTQERVENYENQAKNNLEDFDVLKREYSIAELKYWLLIKDTQEICERDVSTILYFYNENDICPECRTQGFVLSYLKNIFKEKLLTFSFDASLEEESIVEILLSAYEINEYPALLINDKLYQGFQSRDEILKVICENLSEELEECS